MVPKTEDRGGCAFRQAARGSGDPLSPVWEPVCVRTCARLLRGPGDHLSLTGVAGRRPAEALPVGHPSRRRGDAVIPSSAPAGPPQPPPIGRPLLPDPLAASAAAASCSGAARRSRPGRSSGAGRAPPSPPAAPEEEPPRPSPSSAPPRPAPAAAPGRLASSGRGRRPSREDAAALADAALFRLPVGAGHRLLHVLGGRLRTGRGRGRRRRQEGEWGACPRPGPRNPRRPCARAPPPRPLARTHRRGPRGFLVPPALLRPDLGSGHPPPPWASRPSPSGWGRRRPLGALRAREGATPRSSRGWGR